LNRDVGALIRKNEKKGRKHESHRNGSGGSAGPLYFRGFLGEIRSMDSRTRDSFWGLKETSRVVEPQYVPPEPPVEAPQVTPLAFSPVMATRPSVNAKGYSSSYVEGFSFFVFSSIISLLNVSPDSARASQVAFSYTRSTRVAALWFSA